jgi:hypothetical protein
MPSKTARSDPLPLFGASTMTAVVRVASLSCQNQEKAQKYTRDRESSGESRLKRLEPFPQLARVGDGQWTVGTSGASGLAWISLPAPPPCCTTCTSSWARKGTIGFALAGPQPDTRAIGESARALRRRAERAADGPSCSRTPLKSVSKRDSKYWRLASDRGRSGPLRANRAGGSLAELAAGWREALRAGPLRSARTLRRRPRARTSNHWRASPHRQPGRLRARPNRRPRACAAPAGRCQ